MKWSNFTLENYKKINNANIIKNNLLINKMNKDKLKIINSNEIKFDISYTDIDNNFIKECSSGKWVYKDGLFKDLDNLKYEIEIKWNNNIIYIKCNEHKIVSILNRLHVLLKVINHINNENKKLRIYLILSNLKKNIDNNKVLEAKHINSGYSHGRDKYIFIWREEEFEKVLFHEIIHQIEHDHRYEDYDLDKYNDKSFYESLTDTKAIYYNIIYLSILSNENIDKLLNIEMNFIINQANYMNNLINNNYKQISPVYSYYIIKAKIFKYLLSNNMNETLYNKLFIKNIYGNELINIIYNHELHPINYVYLDSNRMTILELN